MITTTLDCRGLSCPLPILKTKQALKTLSAGDVLILQATDPGSESDVKAFAQRTGTELLESLCREEEFVFTLRKS